MKPGGNTLFKQIMRWASWITGIFCFGFILFAQSSAPWYSHAVTGIGINIWAPEWYAESITKFDAENLADSLAKAGVQVAFTFQGFSQDHFGVSYYPTRHGTKHRNMNLRHNLRQYIEQHHKPNIKIHPY
jgi:hypothetical protein